MKRLTAVLLALMLVLTLTACAGSQNKPDITPPANVTGPATNIPVVETIPLTLLCYTDVSPELADVFNDILNTAGFPAEVELLSHIEDGTTTSILNYYSAGLPTADLSLFVDYSIMTQMYQKGLLADLEPYTVVFPQLFTSLPEQALDAATFDGVLLGYPLLSEGGVAARESSVLLRGDILNQLGADVPESPQELLELCVLARDAGLPCDLVIDGIPPYAFHRTYPQWPFHVDINSLILIDEDGVSAYAESEIFAQDTELYGLFREENVLRPLYFHQNRITFAKDNDALACIYPTQFSADFEHKDELISVQFSPEVGNMHTGSPYKSFVSLSSGSQSPEAAMQLLELIYTNREVYNTLVFGTEGEYWVIDEQGFTDIKNADDGNSIGAGRFATYPMNQFPPQHEDKSLRFGEETILDFDPGVYNFAADISIINRIFTSPGFADPEGMFSIRDGSADSALLPQAVNRMNNAGLSQVIEQYRSQYEAFTAG